MGKKFTAALNVVAWLTGVIVSLAVGFALTGNGALNQSIPWLSGIANGAVVAVVGWIVIVTTLISAVLALMKQ
jgi:hypothetical protein